MQVIMNRSSFEVFIGDLSPEASVTMQFKDEKPLKDKADEEGNVYFDCKKIIPKKLREEVVIAVNEKGKPNMEYVYEIRMTKLVSKRIIEVRKEK